MPFGFMAAQDASDAVAQEAPNLQRWDEQQHHQLQLDHHAQLDAAELAAATAQAATPPASPSRSITYAPNTSMPWTETSTDSRPSVYEGGTPNRYEDRSVDSLADTLRSASFASPDTALPESPLTADPPRGRGFDYRHAIDNVDPNFDAGVMDAAGLRVAHSAYWGLRHQEIVDNVGDALFARVDIEPGTLIATFNGTRISRAAARNIPQGENNYLISMQDGTVLDCMANATARPARCLASKANQSTDLQDRITQRALTYNDNNAYVVWRLVDGVMEATLYAVRRIAEGEEIMWSYGPSFDLGFDTDTDYSDASSEELSDDDSLNSRALSPDPLALRSPRGGRLRLLDATQRLQAVGFPPNRDGYDNESGDACPEWAINSSNASYESSADELPASPEVSRPFSGPHFRAEGVNTAVSARPSQPTAAELWQLTLLVQREPMRAQAPPPAAVRRRIAPQAVPRSSAEDKEDEGKDAKTGPG